MKKSRTLTKNEVIEKEHFDAMAKEYDHNYTYDHPFTQYKIQKKMATLFAGLDRNSKLKILEIGAGTGEYTQHLAQYFPKAEIWVTDISPSILAVAKRKCSKYKNLKFKVASAFDLPFNGGSFDLVCGFYILHHLDIEPCLLEANRVLKKGGSGLFYEPNILNPVVYAVKKNLWLKHLAGDSPNEWAINPLHFRPSVYKFRDVQWQTSEFVVIPNFIPLSVATVIDSITSVFSQLPVLKLLGGSVALFLKK